MSGRTGTWYFAGIIAFLWLAPAAVSAQQPTTREYPSLYKSPRAMGMGGAYTAVGGRTDTLFYNPAGLSAMPRDKGWEVNLINVSAELNKDAIKFLNDMEDALDVRDANGNGNDSDEKLQAVNDILAKYRGEILHARVADFTSIGKNFDKWAFGVGGIGNGRVDAIAHQGFGADGFLEVDADAIYGAIAGASVELANNLYGGMSIKYLHRESLTHNFTAREFIDNQNNLDEFVEKDLRMSGNAVGVDAGMLWKFAQGSALKPAIGASVMNMGGLHFGRAGSIPMSVNAGVSINPAVAAFRSLILALDYVDVLNNYKQDKDMVKRLRYGAELQLFDVWPAEMSLRAGVYENHATLGADLRLLFLTVSYVMYSEEIGAFAGQDKDKRQLLTVNIGW